LSQKRHIHLKPGPHQGPSIREGCAGTTERGKIAKEKKKMKNEVADPDIRQKVNGDLGRRKQKQRMNLNAKKKEKKCFTKIHLER